MPARATCLGMQQAPISKLVLLVPLATPHQCPYLVKQVAAAAAPRPHAPLSPAYCRYCAGNYKPEMPSLEELEPGTFYLVEVDARYRRAYARKPPSH